MVLAGFTSARLITSSSSAGFFERRPPAALFGHRGREQDAAPAVLSGSSVLPFALKPPVELSVTSGRLAPGSRSRRTSSVAGKLPRAGSKAIFGSSSYRFLLARKEWPVPEGRLLSVVRPSRLAAALFFILFRRCLVSINNNPGTVLRWRVSLATGQGSHSSRQCKRLYRRPAQGLPSPRAPVSHHMNPDAGGNTSGFPPSAAFASPSISVGRAVCREFRLTSKLSGCLELFP